MIKKATEMDVQHPEIERDRDGFSLQAVQGLISTSRKVERNKNISRRKDPRRIENNGKDPKKLLFLENV